LTLPGRGLYVYSGAEKESRPMKDRYLTSEIVSDLHAKKMVFLGGPRQVGKTTLASTLVASKFDRPAYFNWDNRQDRRQIMASAWPADADLIALDEIHKYRKWKGFIKGEYDKNKDRFRFILTGSSRMDVFRKGGDSLQGRYHFYRLHPFSAAELENRKNSFVPFKELSIPRDAASASFKDLMHFGGFPEPLTKQNDRVLRRWHNEKIERMFREDIQDIAIIRDIGSMKALSDLLPLRVGSLLSTNAIREDLDVSFRAAAHWLDVLETFYYHFRVYPFVSKAVLAIKKEPKLYLWDWSELSDEPVRFENLIASHLLKFTQYLHDFEGYKTNLYFLRDLAKREVDFLVTVDNRPWFAVEAKTGDAAPAPALALFKEKWKIPFCYQVVKASGVDTLSRGIRIVSADKFLLGLV
jgi:predicted AAA+ superfamily ATPase